MWMAALPFERLLEWGAVGVYPANARAHHCEQAARSYDGCGGMLQWRPSADLAAYPRACDIERYDRRVPEAFKGLRGTSDTLEFFASWTATEVIAKLAKVPILLWIKAFGLAPCAPGAQTAREYAGHGFILRNVLVPELPATITLGYRRRGACLDSIPTLNGFN
jgi:hypothetical protein